MERERAMAPPPRCRGFHCLFMTSVYGVMSVLNRSFQLRESSLLKLKIGHVTQVPTWSETETQKSLDLNTTTRTTETKPKQVKEALERRFRNVDSKKIGRTHLLKRKYSQIGPKDILNTN